MIQLYMQKSCPFCQKVLAAASDMGLEEGRDYEIVEAAKGAAGRDVVVNVGGKSMVPFLVDGTHSMYESADIIEYMKKKKGNG